VNAPVSDFTTPFFRLPGVLHAERQRICDSKSFAARNQGSCDLKRVVNPRISVGSVVMLVTQDELYVRGGRASANDIQVRIPSPSLAFKLLLIVEGA
jgi:hypothetical protein